MAGGVLAAVFRGLVEDARQAARNIVGSISKIFEDTASKEDQSLATILDTEEKNAAGFTDLDHDPDLGKPIEPGGDPGGPPGTPPPDEPLTPKQINALSDDETLAEITKLVPDPAQRARLLNGIDRPKTLLKYLARGTTPDEIENGLAKVASTGVPDGLTADQFTQLSSDLRSGAGKYGDDIRVQGSRAAGVSQPGSDIDVAIRVDPEQFDAIIRERFGNPNPGSNKEATMLHALESGKIQRGELGLSGFGKQLARKYGFADSDISVILRGGATDNGPWVKLR